MQNEKRDRLIELIQQADAICSSRKRCEGCVGFGKGADCVDYHMADHLIAHGVTVQEWISVDDQMPPYNTMVLIYRPTMAETIITDTYFGFYGEDDEWYEGWNCYGEDIHGRNVVTHWMPLPQPPKGE